MITLRLATIEDEKLLLSWRNDPSAYINFRNAALVDLQEHEKWFRKVLNNVNCQLYIILDENHDPVGQVRFDTLNEGAEISITVDKKFRGRGYGFDSIVVGTDTFFRQHGEIKKIYAAVKKTNLVSINTFIKAGYKQFKINSDEVVLVFENSNYFSYDSN